MHGVSFLTVLFVSSSSDSDTIYYGSRSSFFWLFVLIPCYFDAVEEGRVASFLLATTAILQLRHAIMKRMMLLEVGFCYISVGDFASYTYSILTSLLHGCWYQ